MGFGRKDTLESPLRREVEANKKKVEQRKDDMSKSEYAN